MHADILSVIGRAGRSGERRFIFATAVQGFDKLSSKPLLAATHPSALRPFHHYWAIKVFG